MERGGEIVARGAFGREKARVLLASMLCAGRPVHREELFDWHWPDLAPEKAVRAFHVTMHALRRALEPDLPRGAQASAIVSAGEHYEVVFGDDDQFDADRFITSADSAPHENPNVQLRRLLDCEAAYTGPLYPEWPYADWAAERRRLCEAALVTVLGHLGRLLVALDRPAQAVPRFERLLSLEPEREEWHRALMLAYEHAGERALGLRQFHACRTVMSRELGVEPSPETQAIYRRLLGPPGPSTPAGVR